MLTVEIVKEFLTKSFNWLNEAIIVKSGDNYEVIPQSYLTDKEYTGSREVILMGGKELALRLFNGKEDLDDVDEKQWLTITGMLNEWI